MHLDDLGLQTLATLKRTLPNVPTASFLGRPPLANCQCSIGLEIEVPWRVYFPELWAKHFCAGQKEFTDFSITDKIALEEESTPQEACLVATLNKTLDCGLGRGKDWYWEFVIPPVFDIRILAEEVSILHTNKLCPWGPHSLQPTIGGLRRTRTSYFALLALELLFATPERIAKGIHKKIPTWATGWGRKGRGGISRKGSMDLQHGDTQAIELRTLCLPASLEEFYSLLAMVSLLSTWLSQEQHGTRIPQWDWAVLQLEHLLADFGFESGHWENPHTNPDIWQRYIAHFYDMKKSASSFLSELVDCSLLPKNAT